MIRVLEKHVADKIAAGEVIDRPVSIIKELVENSLDADARSVTVEITKGGKEYLRVSDDGCGIPADEAELAFLRHATSKIEREEDLDAISSLGFRGEALASICAVARVDMITRTRDAHTGRHLTAEGSEILSNTATGCPEGTTITVRDLFYNVPARRKFLASDGAESRRIIDLMSRIALAYPDVRFRLLSGRREIFQTTGRGNILDNIQRIYGRDITRDLVAVDASEKGMVLRGFVSTPAASVSARNRQFFCVNGRVVSSRTMERGLEKAYRERLFAGRFPIAFLFLSLPADQLDVNVHPTKKEIRFDSEFAVEDFITEAVTKAIAAKEAIPRAAASSGHTVQRQESPVPKTSAEEVPEKPEHDADRDAETDSIFSVPDQGSQVDIKNILETMREDAQTEDTKVKEETAPYEGREGTGSSASEKQPAASQSLDIASLQVIGSVLNTYIVATDGEALYLIDQHAAHERIFYEKLLRQYHDSDKYRQEMLLPIQISVSAQVENAEDLWIGYLRDMGYDIENFGSRTYIVRAMPAFGDPAECEAFLRQMLLELEEKPDPRDFAGLDRLIMRSCKSAVKGGDVLHPSEIRALLSGLSACDTPWSCPHGRPTIVKMTRYDLEKMFKRQG